jgi:hypothetical protein
MTRLETLDTIHDFGKSRRVLETKISEGIKVGRIKRDGSSCTPLQKLLRWKVKTRKFIHPPLNFHVASR